MSFHYKEYESITGDIVRNQISNDILKFLDVYADHYAISFKNNHDIRQLIELNEERDKEMKQILDICVRCLKLVEGTIEDRK